MKHIQLPNIFALRFPAWNCCGPFLGLTFCQTSRLENPEGLQLHLNHEKSLFMTVLLLFEQYKMHYW
jgi:hypothetical protein